MSAAPAILHRPKAWARAPGVLRGVAAVMVAGGIAGLLVGGVGSRVAMRLVALAAPEGSQGLLTEAGARVGEITLEGTVFLVLFAGVGSALFGSAFYLATVPWLPRRRPLRAVTFGALELAAFGAIVIDPANPDFTILGRPLLNVLVFGSLFLLHGTALVMLVAPSARLVELVAGAGVWRNRFVDVATVLALGVMALAGAALVGRGSGWSALATAALLACAAGLALIDPRRARPITRPALRAFGAAALAVVVASGAVELVDAVTTIV